MELKAEQKEPAKTEEGEWEGGVPGKSTKIAMAPESKR